MGIMALLYMGCVVVGGTTSYSAINEWVYLGGDDAPEVPCMLDSECNAWNAKCVKGKCKCVAPYYASTTRCEQYTIDDCNEFCSSPHKPPRTPGATELNICGSKNQRKGKYLLDPSVIWCECAKGYVFKYADVNSKDRKDEYACVRDS